MGPRPGDATAIVVASYVPLGHVTPWSLRVQTNLAVSIYVHLQWTVNSTHFPVPATDSQSLKYINFCDFC